MLSNCGAGEDSWESHPWTARRSALNIHWKGGCWSSNMLATWYEELTHWKRPWCWEIWRAGEGGGREWDGWMASPSLNGHQFEQTSRDSALPTQWTWVWVNSRNWWWTGKPGVLQSMGLQRVRCDQGTELNSEGSGEQRSLVCWSSWGGNKSDTT